MNNDIQNDRLCNQYGIVDSNTKWFVNIPSDNQVLQFDKNFMECGKRSTHNDFYITTLPQNTSIFHGSSALTENLILVPTGIKYDDSIRDNKEIKPELLLDTENDNILEELEKYGSISPAWFTSVEAANLYGGTGENKPGVYKCGVKKLTTISDQHGTYTVNTNQCILAFKTKKDVKLIMLDNVYNFVKIYNYIISMSEKEFNKLYKRIRKEIKNSPKPQEYFHIPTNKMHFANMYTYFFTGPLTEDFSTDYTVDSGFFQNYGIKYDKQSSSSESRFYLYDKLNGDQRVPYVPRFSVTNYDLPLSIFFCYLAEKFDCDGFAVNETRRSTNYEQFYNNRPASVQEKMIEPTRSHHVEISLCKVHKNLYRDYNNPLDWQYKASNNIDVPYHVKKYITLLNTKFLNVNYEEYAGSYYENTVWATLFTEFLFTQNGPLLNPKLSNKDKILKKICSPLKGIFLDIKTFIGIDEDKKNLERFSKLCTCMAFLHNFRQIMGDDSYCNNKNDKRRCVQNDRIDVKSSEFLSYSLIESVYTNSFGMSDEEYKEDMKLVRLYFDSYLETSSLFNQLLSLISDDQDVSELVKKIFDKLIKYLVYKYYLIFHIDKMHNEQIQKIDNMVLGVFLSCYIVSFSIYNTKNSFNHIVNINNDQRQKINLFYKNGVIQTIDNSINLQSSIIPGISNISKNYPGSQIDDNEIINQIERQLIFIKNFMVTKNYAEKLFVYTLINEENNNIARDNLKNNIYNRLVQSIFQKIYVPTLKIVSNMEEEPTAEFTKELEEKFRKKSDSSFLKSGKIIYDRPVKGKIDNAYASMVDNDSLFPKIIDSKYIFEFSDKLRTREYVLLKLNYESVKIDRKFTSLYEIYSAQLYTKYINNVTQRLFNETIDITDKQIRDVKGNPKDRILGLYNLIVKKVCSIICVEYSTNHYPHLITPLPRINHNVLNHIRSLWFSCLILMNKIQSEKYNNYDIVLIMISSFMKSINRISESGGDVKCCVNNINDLLQIDEIKELKQEWPGLITENVELSSTGLSTLCMHVQVLKTLSAKLDFKGNCSKEYYNYVIFATSAHSASHDYSNKELYNFSCLINAPHYLDHCRFSTAFSQLDNNSMAMLREQPNDLNSPSKWLTDYLNEVNMDNNVIKEYYHQQQLHCLTLSGLNVKDIKQITKNLPNRCRLTAVEQRLYGDTFLEYCNNPTIALSEMFEKNNFKLISEY